MSLPAIRRVITGHDANGKAIIESDNNLTPINPITGAPFSSDSGSDGLAPFAFTVAYRTSGFPASNSEPPIEYHGKKIDLEHKTGSTCRIVDFPPLEDEKVPEGFMHRTQSMDFAVVMKGRIVLVLDDSIETEVKEGDVVIQRYRILVHSHGRIAHGLILGHRGTIHAWKNLSKENCRMLFVLIPAEKVKVESTGEYLEKTPTPQLLGKEET
jgi:quercetin dioxygenase-like cupin family protein